MKEYNFKINGNDYAVSISDVDDTTAEVLVNGTAFHVEFDGIGQSKVKKATPQVVSIPGVAATSATGNAAQPSNITRPAAESSPASGLKSPLPGVIVDIKVSVGDSVKAGDHLMVLEAMKMENNIDADRDGVIKAIAVSRGDSVLEGDVLLTIG